MAVDHFSTVRIADEEDWLELLVASERIAKWLDAIRSGTQQQQRQAVRQLCMEVQAKDTYAEEAKAAGAVGVLTTLISRTDNEDMIDTAAAIVSACGGPMAGGGKVKEVRYGQHSIWIQEGLLGDGLGARIWAAAHILCREQMRRPELVKGLRVLELGSGCGLCGLLAARLGAEQVTLTDYEHKVLLNLRECVVRNMAPGQPAPSARDSCSAPTETSSSAPCNASQIGSKQLLVSASGVSGSSSCANGKRPSGWEMGNVSIRFLDWSEALGPVQTQVLQEADSVLGQPRNHDGPPGLGSGERFPVVIGSDLLYEVYHADLLAAILADRLASDGTAYLALSVRRQVHLQRLKQQCSLRGLAAEVGEEQVVPDDVGIIGREHEYEGGFVLVTIKRITTSCDERSYAQMDTCA